MYGGVSLFLRILNFSARKRLATVLVIFAVILGCYELAFPATYFVCLLLLPLVCAAWLFGWRGGLLCLAGLALALGIRYELTLGDLFWHTTPLMLWITGTLFGLVVCLAIGALQHITRLLLDERQNRAHLQLAYQQEHTLNEWKDHTLQDLNHELRIPLTQTDGYLELLETYRDTLDASTQAHFIALARSGCEELLNLTRTALEMLQASGRQYPLNLSVFSLRHEIHNALAHCEPRLLQEHHIELDIPEETHVYADAHFVNQIVRNLLTNACKYTPSRTRITVSATSMSLTDRAGKLTDMVCVRVQDYGRGIPPEQQARLFQRFVRLPNASTSEQPGSGLGLAICKHLVEAMGGIIRLESTGKDGEGCCFSFTLMSRPAPDADNQTKRTGGNHDQPKTLSHEEQHAAPTAGRSS